MGLERRPGSWPRSAPARGWIASGLLTLLAAGSAGSASTVDYSWVPVLEPSAQAVPDPPGDRWLVDPRGREYTLFRWRKHEGYYRKEEGPERVVRLRYGIRFILEHEDGEYLYLRWYRTRPIRDRLVAGRAVAPANPLSGTVHPPERDALRLAPWDEGLPHRGQWRNAFAVADMNGDGHPDLVHGPPRKGPYAGPAIFLGDGTGRWRRWSEARFPRLPYAYGGVAAGDLDGDGRMDLVLAAHLGGIFALRGDGRGGFVPWSEGLPSGIRPARTEARGTESPPEVAQLSSRAIALADWDGDGRPDVLALSEGPTSVRDAARPATPAGKMIFLNRGDGTWVPVHGPGNMMGDRIVPADLDGDGQLDFVTDSRVVGSGEILNYGLAGRAWRVASLPEPLPRLRVRAVAVADLDGDGRPDLALSYQSQQEGGVQHGLDVYFGTRAGWRRVVAWADDARSAEPLTALAAGDLDGDGRADLVALGARGGAWLLLNEGNGGFALDRSPEADPDPDHVGCAGYAVAVTDLDGDGVGEVVAAFAGEPGSEALLGGAAPVRCRAGGALRVWKVRRQG